jgi:D-alanine-D-alanine ligase
VAVLLGGRSVEHEISCLSGRAIVTALDPRLFDVTVVGIRRDGRWVRADDGGLGLLDGSGALPSVAVDAPVVDPATVLDVDVVFPALHGPWGEDGSIQGLLETLGLPYVGSGVLASALAMDKGFMKQALAAAGVPVGDYAMVTHAQWRDEPDTALARVAELGLPVFVKPARAGSSLGISKVVDARDLPAAIEHARAHDPRVIVEAAVVDAREIECAALADDSGRPQASCCAEIVVGGHHEFYDFEAKYLDDSATLIVPAALEPAVEQEVQRLTRLAFEALACEGLARVDFFVGPRGILVNEVNTMPGFTPISLFPRMWAEAGLTMDALVEHLVRDALRRGSTLR